jgi:hypothetical protein
MLERERERRERERSMRKGLAGAGSEGAKEVLWRKGVERQRGRVGWGWGQGIARS